MPTTSSTTLTSVALLIWKILQAQGPDSHSIFNRANLDPTKLGDGNARYSLIDMRKLWEISIKETNDPCFGIEVGKSWAPTTFHALGLFASFNKIGLIVGTGVFLQSRCQID